MISFRNVRTALAYAVLTVGPQACMSQFDGPPMGGMGGGPGGEPPGGRQESRRSVMASGSHLLTDLQRQLDDLRLALKLRPQQEAAWQRYQEQVGALMNDQLRPSRRSEAADRDDALHQINREVDVVRNRLAALEDIADAAHRLYSQLDARQRVIADHSLALTIPTLYSGMTTDAPSERAMSGRPPYGRGPPPD